MLRIVNESIDSKLIKLVSIISILLILAACSNNLKEAETFTSKKSDQFDPMSIALPDPEHTSGRETWMKTCQTCHLTGLTGAPIIGNKAAWEPRIAKGLDTLFDHALNGFIGPTYSEMPPKGGFTELSDEEVKQAVKFMTFASQ